MDLSDWLASALCVLGERMEEGGGRGGWEKMPRRSVCVCGGGQMLRSGEGVLRKRIVTLTVRNDLPRYDTTGEIVVNPYTIQV